MADLSHIKNTKVEAVITVPAENGGYLVPVFERTAANGDKWYVLPGGKFAEAKEGRGDETSVEGVIRETDEELGVKLKPEDIKAILADQLNHPKTPKTLTTFMLVSCPKGQYPRNADPAENGELMLLKPHYASQLIGDRATQEVHELLQYLGNKSQMENTPS